MISSFFACILEYKINKKKTISIQELSVDVNIMGNIATTLYLDLYTNYSKPNQKHERILIRTEDVKKKDYIGEIIWD